MSWKQKALDRVKSNDDLTKWSDVLLYDDDEWKADWQRVATAPVSELTTWAHDAVVNALTTEIDEYLSALCSDEYDPPLAQRAE